MFARILLWCCLILDFYLLRIFFITGLISLLIIGLLSFFIFPDSVWEDFIFLGICSFLLCCPFYRHTIVRNNLSWSFVFRCSWLYLIFHLWFYWFVPPLFFSWWIWPNIYLSFMWKVEHASELKMSFVKTLSSFLLCCLCILLICCFSYVSWFVICLLTSYNVFLPPPPSPQADVLLFNIAKL